MNSVRSRLAEFGIIAAQGHRGFMALVQLVATGDARLPAVLIAALRMLSGQIERSTGRQFWSARSWRPPAPIRDSAARRGARHRAVNFACHRDPDRRRRPIHLGARLCRLVRSYPPGRSKRQHTARARHLAAGRDAAAQAPRAWRQHHHAACQIVTQAGYRMAARHPRTPPGQGCGPGASRQKRPHRLGHAAVRRRLSPFPTRHSGGGPIASGRINSSVSQQGKEHKQATAKWSGPGLEYSVSSSRSKARRNAGSPIRVTHRGQRSPDRINRPDTSAAPDQCRRHKSPCTTGAVQT